jgi:hypothetical protein
MLPHGQQADGVSNQPANTAPTIASWQDAHDVQCTPQQPLAAMLTHNRLSTQRCWQHRKGLPWTFKQRCASSSAELAIQLAHASRPKPTRSQKRAATSMLLCRWSFSLKSRDALQTCWLLVMYKNYALPKAAAPATFNC